MKKTNKKALAMALEVCSVEEIRAYSQKHHMDFIDAVAQINNAAWNSEKRQLLKSHNGGK